MNRRIMEGAFVNNLANRRAAMIIYRILKAERKKWQRSLELLYKFSKWYPGDVLTRRFTRARRMLFDIDRELLKIYAQTIR